MSCDLCTALLVDFLELSLDELTTLGGRIQIDVKLPLPFVVSSGIHLPFVLWGFLQQCIRDGNGRGALRPRDIVSCDDLQ